MDPFHDVVWPAAPQVPYEPRRRRARLRVPAARPIGRVTRHLVAPDGSEHQVEVPVYGPDARGEPFVPDFRRDRRARARIVAARRETGSAD